MNRHHAPRHYHGHHHRSRPHRPRPYEVHRARRRGQTLAMIVVTAVGLSLLFAFVALVEGGRDGFRHGAGGALLDEPWK